MDLACLNRSYRVLARLATAAAMAVACLAAESAFAQKPGGVLQVAHRDSPASMSTLEEVTISTVAPMMAVFNNLVIFDQHVPQNTLQSIVPDLATNWSWNEGGTELTFRLREGVRWHDAGIPSPDGSRRPFSGEPEDIAGDIRSFAAIGVHELI
jgi:ABC-type transport system substrate-binding protein